MKQRLLGNVSQIALCGMIGSIAAMALTGPIMPAKAMPSQAMPSQAMPAKAETRPRAADPIEARKREPGERDTGSQVEAPDEPGASSAETPPDWVLAHGPYTHWYTDTTELVTDRTAAGEENAWRDLIGTRVFDTKGIAARWDGEVLSLAIFTNFPDRNVMSAGRMVAPADLALDLDGDGTLETGVVLSGVPSSGDRGVVRAPSIRKGTAYHVTNWLRPDDILVYTYGQGWRWAGVTGEELADASVPVWVGEGTARNDLAVTVDWRVNGSGSDDHGSDYVVFVTLTKTTGDGDLSNVPIIWGTAVCGNDVMFAPVARVGDMVETGGVISEDVSEDSDESGPRWNNTYPVAFPGSTGGNSPSATHGGSARPRGGADGFVGPGWDDGFGGSGGGGPVVVGLVAGQNRSPQFRDRHRSGCLAVPWPGMPRSC